MESVPQWRFNFVMSFSPHTSPESSRHEDDRPLPPQGLQSEAVETNSRHPREGGDPSSLGFLSEAFLDSSASRIRAEIPQEYQKHFDELRSAILSFCHTFEIPTESLSNVEAFGAQLNAKKISHKKMGEVLLLFQRLEYLIAHKEPFQEKLSGEVMEYAERLYHLQEQYAAQVHLLEDGGILEDGIITGIDGHAYPVPTFEQIALRLYERKEELQTKRDQGFTKLLLVPFGMSLTNFLDVLNQSLFTKGGKKQFVSTENIFYTNAEIDLFYHPTSFDHDDGGQTKQQILDAEMSDPTAASFAPGWRVILLQSADPKETQDKGVMTIPARGEEGICWGRRDLCTGDPPREYLKILQEAQKDLFSPYHGESGMTVEDWIIAFLTHFEETGEFLDTFSTTNGATPYLMGNYFFGYVPHVCFAEGRVNLFRRGVDGAFEDSGTRFVVVV